MKLLKLLEGLKTTGIKGDANIEITSVIYDSRLASNGSLFVCKGFQFEPRYIKDAVDSGAVAIVKQSGIECPDIPDNITCVDVEDSRYALAHIAAAFYGHPSKKLKLTGVTGTKGKTTITYMIKSIMENSSFKVGLIGSIQNMIGNDIIYTERTTPESLDLQSLFDEMVCKKVDRAVMEVSSQGLKYHRVTCSSFETGIFTNISCDHIGPGEHDDFQDYLNSKALLFKMCRNAVINADSEYADYIIGMSSAKELLTYGIEKKADVMAENIILSREGVSFDLKAPWWEGHIHMDTIGKFNVYNALAAISVCGLAGVSFENVRAGLANVKVKGRVELVHVEGRDFTIIIDYAHNAASLKSLLEAIREYAPGRIVCLFGCGGDRDPERRFEMGEISGKLADFTIITSDNPRSEDPQKIINNIETGIKRTQGEYVTILDRTEAIRYAIKTARKDDIIILAGKGHENYQIFSGKTIHYDEREVVASILNEIDAKEG